MTAINWREGEGLKALAVLLEMKKAKKKYKDIATTINNSFKLDALVTGDKVKHAYNRNSEWFENTYKNEGATGVKVMLPVIPVEVIEAMAAEPEEPEVDPEDENKRLINEAKEKARKAQEKKLVSKLLKERGATELIVETFENSIKAFEWKDIQPPEPINVTPEYEEALLLFSDAQIGEHITLEDTNGLGEYNIGIFQERMDRLVSEMRELTKIQSYARDISVLNIFMLGDNVDGIGIYRGQEHHLDALVVEQLLIGAEKIAESLIKLLGTFKTIKITGIVGNHGRIGRKGENPSHVNFDYLLYKMLEKLLSNYNDRIIWTIPKSNWHLTEVNGQDFLLLHGETIKGWNGIPYYGIDRADSRFTKMLSGFGKSYRYLCLGHHHNPGDVDSPNGEKILNGTMVGGSLFSINMLHTSSRPSQWFFGIHKKKGITWRHKIILDQE